MEDTNVPTPPVNPAAGNPVPRSMAWKLIAINAIVIIVLALLFTFILLNVKNTNTTGTTTTPTPTTNPTTNPTTTVPSTNTPVPSQPVGQTEFNLAKQIGTWPSIAKVSEVIECPKSANSFPGDGSKSDTAKFDTVEFKWTYPTTENSEGYTPPPSTAPQDTMAFQTGLINAGWTLCAREQNGAAGSGRSYSVYKNADGRFAMTEYKYGNLANGGKEVRILLNVGKGFTI